MEVASYPVSIFIAGSVWDAESACRDFCDEVGFCVTVTETNYCFTGGEEAGVIVGLINYPRFPAEPWEIRNRATDLAALLCDRLKQQSYTIQTPEKTVWISHREEDQA
ncbi:MAG TPA: hypothetical protein VF637_05815 [Sphingomicrobium sp.]